MVRQSNIPLPVKRPCAACLQSLPALSVKADGNDILPGHFYHTTLLFLNSQTYNFARKSSRENFSLPNNIIDL